MKPWSNDEVRALTVELNKHALNTASQDSGQHCKCGSASRAQQVNDPPWSSIDEHRAQMVQRYLRGGGRTDG